MAMIDRPRMPQRPDLRGDIMRHIEYEIAERDYQKALAAWRAQVGPDDGPDEDEDDDET
jgi:hypothetical protein